MSDLLPYGIDFRMPASWNRPRIKAWGLANGLGWPEDRVRQRALVDEVLKVLREDQAAKADTAWRAREAYAQSPTIEALLHVWCKRRDRLKRQLKAFFPGFQTSEAFPNGSGYPPWRIAGPLSYDPDPWPPDRRRLGHLPSMDEQENEIS